MPDGHTSPSSLVWNGKITFNAGNLSVDMFAIAQRCAGRKVDNRFMERDISPSDTDKQYPLIEQFNLYRKFAMSSLTNYSPLQLFIGSALTVALCIGSVLIIIGGA